MGSEMCIRDRDMGALVPAGASISGEPPAQTAQASATLQVGGPGIVAYKYRGNSGPYGPETPVGTPIDLSGLADGDYTVYVLGKNAAGVWQSEPTASQTWTVASSLRRVELSEVLAINRSTLEVDGTFPDYIELHNPGASDFDLGGLSITDDPDEPTKFVFSPGTVSSGQSSVHGSSTQSSGSPPESWARAEYPIEIPMIRITSPAITQKVCQAGLLLMASPPNIATLHRFLLRRKTPSRRRSISLAGVRSIHQPDRRPIPRVGRFCTFQDPQGAILCAITYVKQTG